MKRESGLTLIEVLIAVSLLSLLSVGILTAMRIGLNAMGKTNTKLMDNRRVAGTQQVLEQQIAGFIPVMAASPKMPFFQGEPRSMRFVSSYSLQEAARGIPQILEFQVIAGAEGRGVRLVVNETPYTGPLSAGSFCIGLSLDPSLGVAVPHFRPIQTGPRSFVLADKLASCRFAFLESRPKPVIEEWRDHWIFPVWPVAIAVEMTPLDPDPAKLRMMSVTAPVRVTRKPLEQYADF